MFPCGPSGARSRDLRIKRPDGQSALRACFYGLTSWVKKAREPRVNHEALLRPLWGVDPRSTHRTPPAPDSDDDVMAPLRRVTSGALP